MKDCTTCKYGYEDERLGIPMCHHPKRFSEDCVDFNMYEEKEVKKSEIPKDLEEYASRAGFDYVDNIVQEHPGHRFNDHDVEYAYRDGIIAGAKWHAEQMLKEAVEEVEVGMRGEPIEIILDKYVQRAMGIFPGDKVRVIIVKE